MLTHEHVQHLTRRNDTLSMKVDKLKGKAASITKQSVHLLEVTAGAALGGVIQGMAKDPTVGPHILKVPVDLGVGIALNLAAALDLAGSEWSSHLGNVGTGFLAAYFSDVGFKIGQHKVQTGSFFGKGATVPMLAPGFAGLPGGLPPAVQGAVSPQEVANQLFQNMQGQ